MFSECSQRGPGMISQILGKSFGKQYQMNGRVKLICGDVNEWKIRKDIIKQHDFFLRLFIHN